MEDLHVKIIAPSAIYDDATGHVSLPEAGSFDVIIQEYEADLLTNKYAGVRWIYQAAEDRPILTRESFNKDFDKGSVKHTLNFPKAFEGGGKVYIEAYQYDPIQDVNNPQGRVCHPQGKAPYGCLISALGKPQVIAAEWKDKDGHNITGHIAYGSTLYLHIYTEGLYGQDIQVKLIDTHRGENDLPLNNAGGEPIKGRSSDASSSAMLIGKVRVYTCDMQSSPQLGPPVGVEANKLSSPNISGANKEKAWASHVQKCILQVLIDSTWQFQDVGSLAWQSWYNSDARLSISPVVYFKGGQQKL